MDRTLVSRLATWLVSACRFSSSVAIWRWCCGRFRTLAHFDQLGTPPVVKELCFRPRGLFLVTGPTGSGKSTTLASMINYINEQMDHHIVTVEDPIEFYHVNKGQR